MGDYCGVKVLFLAKYAPVDLNSLIPSGIEDYIYAEMVYTRCPSRPVRWFRYLE